jgi:transposase-like protein
VFPDTAEQRCWFHKIANVLAALPKSAHPPRFENGKLVGRPDETTPKEAA